MTVADDRTAKIGKLDAIRLKGVNAYAILRDVQPVIDKIRGIYLDELVDQTRAKGEADKFNVYRLVALDDIETILREQASRGARAAAKLRQIESAGGSET